MRFEKAYEDWQKDRLRQEEAVRLLGVCERTFRLVGLGVYAWKNPSL